MEIAAIFVNQLEPIVTAQKIADGDPSHAPKERHREGEDRIKRTLVNQISGEHEQGLIGNWQPDNTEHHEEEQRNRAIVRDPPERRLHKRSRMIANQMRSAASPAVARDADGMRAILERFLKSCRNPCLFEPGEELLPLTPDSFSMEAKDSRLTIQAWSDTRNIVRRVISVCAERRGRLELVVERFARNAGPMFLIDMDRPDSQETGRRGGRLVFRERFRRFLTREFPSWKLSEISAEPDLEHSLSPAFPR